MVDTLAKVAEVAIVLAVGHLEVVMAIEGVFLSNNIINGLPPLSHIIILGHGPNPPLVGPTHSARTLVKLKPSPLVPCTNNPAFLGLVSNMPITQRLLFVMILMRLSHHESHAIVPQLVDGQQCHISHDFYSR